MANLTASQKKSRNKFVALLIGIIVVALATAYVIYGGVTSKSKLLDNQKFAKALSEITGKTPRGISEDDLSAIKYLEIGYDSTNKQYNLAVGYDDFMTEYEKQLAEAEAEEEAAAASEESEAADNAQDAENTEIAESSNTEKNADSETEEAVDLSTLIKSAVFDGDGEEIFEDIKFFTGVDTISLYSVKLSDDMSFEKFTNLKRGYFNTTGLTTVKGFEALNLDNIETLDFSGNDITDWSGLESIADKVTVFNGYTIEFDEDQNYQYVPYTQTLTDYLEEQKESENASDEVTDETAETTDEATAADDAVDESEADNTQSVEETESAQSSEVTAE